MPGAIAAIDVGSLYDQHVDWLRAWLHRRTRCPHRAADLAQDTYCRLIEKSAELRIETPRTFLATVARRLLVDDIRRRDVERAILDAQALHAANGEEITPERIVEAAQFLDTVLRVLDSLPEQARETFLLRRIEGLAQSDIAERLGISISTVKRHIAAAYAACVTVAYAD
ncbi:sigma-70 family RNA polymerase sigma factor [Novosphingobium sp. TCA1]|uniref:RNA polymerase subunit sigma-70 n=1 Tax=Novosphingobium pentaromativorans TaxID=205844 RepID=A0A2W5NIW4_9SPHN|nr:sigma-70 family RNA polymerase sigma factor [Novosphingobium sp. TCA1]PZQ53441.1 MAG: RNA polymerase subunit sigma-70 [Novosphingobium pentaromativorans]GFE75462.1 ECF family sigma factor [Novosphingobium sp. TCA1]